MGIFPYVACFKAFGPRQFHVASWVDTDAVFHDARSRLDCMINIYVGNLSFRTDDEALRQAFDGHGEIASAKVVMDRDTGRSKGFGFVEMPNREEGLAAIKALDGQEIDGRALRVNEARPREERPRTGGGREGGFAPRPRRF